MKYDIKVIFGKNLKKEREKRNLSQEKFAELIDIGIPALSSIENGKSHPKPQTLQKIIDKLVIPPDVLYKTEEEFDMKQACEDIFKRLQKAQQNKTLFIKIYDKILEMTCGIE